MPLANADPESAVRRDPSVGVPMALAFDRGQAWGMRLDIPAGTAVRFEPGDRKTVTLVETSHGRLD